MNEISYFYDKMNLALFHIYTKCKKKAWQHWQFWLLVCDNQWTWDIIKQILLTISSVMFGYTSSSFDN